MDATIKATATRLSGWAPGQKGWFWLCPGLGEAAPMLLVSAMSEDADMRDLRSAVDAVSLPPGARPRVGVLSADGAGQLSLGGAGLGAADLADLAGWVRSNVADHPGLARLRGCALVRVEDRVVVEQHADPALWEGVAAPPDGMDGTLRRMAKLRPDVDFWFWMTPTGPSGLPHLILGQQRRDPDGGRFSVAVVRLQQAGGEDGVGGVLRQAEGGGLVFTSEAPLEAGLAALGAVADAFPALRPQLDPARVVQTAEGQFVRAGRVSRPDLSRQSALLRGDLSGEPLWFCFTDSADDGEPLLLIEADREALKGAAQAAGGAGRRIRGQLRESRAGWLELRTRDPWPGFIAELARWVGTHNLRWPDLDRLRGARLVQRDRDEAIVDRQKDDDAWAAFA